METSTATKPFNSPSNAARRVGMALSVLCILFMVFDAAMKIIKEPHTTDASIKLGWPTDATQPVGFLLLICTALYAFPRTSVLGAILVTGYLGGATAINARAGYSPWFSILFGILVWLGSYLRNQRLRTLLPFVTTSGA